MPLVRVRVLAWAEPNDGEPIEKRTVDRMYGGAVGPGSEFRGELYLGFGAPEQDFRELMARGLRPILEVTDHGYIPSPPAMGT